MSKYANQQDALQALQDVYAFFSGTSPLPSPPVTPASSAPQTYVGTLKFVTKGSPMFGGWPVTVAMDTDDQKELNISLSDISGAYLFLGLNTGQLNTAKAAIVSLEADWSSYVASLAAGNPLPTPHVSLTLAPPVEEGGYWFLLNYADV